MKAVWISVARVWWLTMLVVVFQSAAWAQGAPTAGAQAEMKAAIEAAQKAQVSGPSDVKLADQAVLKLPKGFVYVPPAEGQKLLTAMGNRVGDGLLGLIFPDSDAEWFVAMRFMMGRKKETGGTPPQA